MNLHSLEMYKFNKRMNWETMCDSAKLAHKMELARFEVLFKEYPNDFNDNYFVTCNVRQNGNNYYHCKFWLKKFVDVVFKPITDFDIFLKTHGEMEKIKWFKKHKKLTPIKFNKWEDDTFIYFDLVVVPFNLFLKPTVISNGECNVCFEKDKRYYIENPFMCNHNEVCMDCNNKIFKTSMKCCICRANMKPNFL